MVDSACYGCCHNLNQYVDGNRAQLMYVATRAMMDEGERAIRNRRKRFNWGWLPWVIIVLGYMIFRFR
jgi:hypothetical protein